MQIIKMSENLSKELEKVLIEDIEAYFKGLKKEDLGFSNILSNRLMTDAVILNSKEYVLLGAILKDILSDIGLFKEHLNVKQVTSKFEDFIKSYLTDDKKLIPISLINDYNNFYKYLLDSFDLPNEGYTKNLEFIELTLEFMLNFFKKEIKDDALPVNLNVLIFGVISEIKRTTRNLGLNSKILMLRLILTYFGRLHEYFRFLLASETKIEKWENLYKEYTDKLISNIDSYKNNDDYINDSIDFLYEICKEWRLMYIRLLELPKTVPIEKEVNIPPDIKQELDEMVTNLIKNKLEEK